MLALEGLDENPENGESMSVFTSLLTRLEFGAVPMNEVDLLLI